MSKKKRTNSIQVILILVLFVLGSVCCLRSFNFKIPDENELKTHVGLITARNTIATEEGFMIIFSFENLPFDGKVSRESYRFAENDLFEKYCVHDNEIEIKTSRSKSDDEDLYNRKEIYNIRFQESLILDYHVLKKRSEFRFWLLFGFGVLLILWAVVIVLRKLKS